MRQTCWLVGFQRVSWLSKTSVKQCFPLLWRALKMSIQTGPKFIQQRMSWKDDNFNSVVHYIRKLLRGKFYLKSLVIENYILIEHTWTQFNEAMSVFTGGNRCREIHLLTPLNLLCGSVTKQWYRVCKKKDEAKIEGAFGVQKGSWCFMRVPSAMTSIHRSTVSSCRTINQEGRSTYKINRQNVKTWLMFVISCATEIDIRPLSSWYCLPEDEKLRILTFGSLPPSNWFVSKRSRFFLSGNPPDHEWKEFLWTIGSFWDSEGVFDVSLRK